MTIKFAISISLAAIAAAMVAACSDRASTSTTSDAVQDGQLDEGHPAVVFLDAGGDSCSGTLIAPDVVLTAAHCKNMLSAYFPHQPVEIDRFVPYIPRGQGPNPTCDEHAGADAPVDLALVHLHQPIVGIAPMPFATAADQLPKLDDAAEVVGFGKNLPPDGGLWEAGTQPDGTYQFADGSHVKRKGLVRVTAVRPIALGTAYLTAQGARGDSGGPLLYRDRIVAVTACGDSELRTGSYVRVDVASAWIARMLTLPPSQWTSQRELRPEER